MGKNEVFIPVFGFKKNKDAIVMVFKAKLNRKVICRSCHSKKHREKSF